MSFYEMTFYAKTPWLCCGLSLSKPGTSISFDQTDLFGSIRIKVHLRLDYTNYEVVSRSVICNCVTME